VSKPSSYLLCGTPRTGSTLLCSLLAGTGVAGRPESYFRQPDLSEWAARFGVPVASDGTFDYRDYVAGVVRHGTSPNGVFGARLMWGMVELAVQAVNPSPSRGSDLQVLDDAFGPLVLVHLRRQDIVGQAVSWARAEQTGYWQQGDSAEAAPRFDPDQIDGLVRTIREHNAAWQAWFSRQGAQPYVVTYEDLVADPGGTVLGILDRLGVEPPPDWHADPPHARQADEVNVEWVRRYHAREM
jgi:trehalose 2-sulfotransferase